MLLDWVCPLPPRLPVSRAKAAAVGNIIICDATETGPIIGQFTVIPEPSTLLLLATAPLLAFHRRRHP